MGCRLAWDSWSQRSRPLCATIDQFSQFERLYESISDTALHYIEEASGCFKPCFYKEYRLAGTIPNTDPLDGFYSFFGLWYVSTEVTVEKESLVYPLPSLVADFGGTLGLFLGFSFMMLWDGVMLATEGLQKIFKNKPTRLE